MCTADGSSDAVEEPPPPNPTAGGADRPPIQIPIFWPDDGSLTLEWVQNLALILDWSSRRVPPSDFPSILPVPVLDRIILTASKIVHGEPNCVRVDVPDGENQRVVGDVHGQLHDLLFLLREAGPPSNDGATSSTAITSTWELGVWKFSCFCWHGRLQKRDTITWEHI